MLPVLVNSGCFTSWGLSNICVQYFLARRGNIQRNSTCLYFASCSVSMVPKECHLYRNRIGSKSKTTTTPVARAKSSRHLLNPEGKPKSHSSAKNHIMKWFLCTVGALHWERQHFVDGPVETLRAWVMRHPRHEKHSNIQLPLNWALERKESQTKHRLLNVWTFVERKGSQAWRLQLQEKFGGAIREGIFLKPFGKLMIYNVFLDT